MTDSGSVGSGCLLKCKMLQILHLETFRPHYSSVKGAKVVSDRLTGRTKGYGFVRFGDESEQLHAMTEMNGKFCSTWPMRIGTTTNKKNVGKAAISCRHVVILHG